LNFRKDEAHHEDQESRHHSHYTGVEGECAGQEAREGVVSPLNNRHFVLLVHLGQPVVLEVNHETEDSESLRSPKFVSVSLGSFRVGGALAVLVHSDLVEGVEHNKLHGQDVGVEGLPLAIHLEF